MADDARREVAVDALRVVDVPVVAADKRRDDVAEGGDVLLVPAVFLIVDVVLAVDVGILDEEAVVVVVVMRDVARVALAVDGFLDVMDPCVLPVVALGGEREMELLLTDVAFDDVKAEVLLVFVASAMVY